MTIQRLLGTASLALLAMVLGCAGASVQTYSKPASGQRQYGKVKKVAVMPFDTVVEGAQAPRIAGDLFLQELLTRGLFEAVEEPRYVAELMKKLKLRNTENLDREIVRKIGEELQAQALVLGDLLLYGEEEVAEVMEFSLQVTVLDTDSGDILWAGGSYAQSSTTFGEIIGINQGPSSNALARTGVGRLAARLEREWRRAREAEVERMLEAAQAEEIGGEELLPPEEGAPAGDLLPEEEAEEILLQVQPK